jgi:hypothetical protein
MTLQPTLFHYLSNPPATKWLLGAQRFTILRGFTLRQAPLSSMPLRISCEHKQAGKRHMLFGFPESTSAERRIVFA